MVNLPSNHVRIVAEAFCKPLIDVPDEIAVTTAVPVISIASCTFVLFAAAVGDQDLRIFHRIQTGGAAVGVPRMT